MSGVAFSVVNSVSNKKIILKEKEQSEEERLNSIINDLAIRWQEHDRLQATSQNSSASRAEKFREKEREWRICTTFLKENLDVSTFSQLKLGIDSIPEHLGELPSDENDKKIRSEKFFQEFETQVSQTLRKVDEVVFQNLLEQTEQVVLPSFFRGILRSIKIDKAASNYHALMLENCRNGNVEQAFFYARDYSYLAGFDYTSTMIRVFNELGKKGIDIEQILTVAESGLEISLKEFILQEVIRELSRKGNFDQALKVARGVIFDDPSEATRDRIVLSINNELMKQSNPPFEKLLELLELIECKEDPSVYYGVIHKLLELDRLDEALVIAEKMHSPGEKFYNFALEAIFFKLSGMENLEKILRIVNENVSDIGIRMFILAYTSANLKKQGKEEWALEIDGLISDWDTERSKLP